MDPSQGGRSALRALRDPAFASLDAARVAEAQVLLDAPPALRTAERFPTLAVSAGPGELAQRAQAVLAVVGAAPS